MPGLWRCRWPEPADPDRQVVHRTLSRWLDVEHHAQRKPWSWMVQPPDLLIGLLDDRLAERLRAGADAANMPVAVALTVLVCYDISHDAVRARVAAYLQQWGDRIQRSVFVCAVSADELGEMVSRVEEMIDPATDAVHLLPTCAACWSRLVVRGQADATPDKPYWAAL